MIKTFNSLFKIITPILVFLLILSGCGTTESNDKDDKQVETDQSEQLKAWLNEVYERDLLLSPEDLTSLGRKERQSELNDMSEEFELKKLAQAEEDLATLQEFKMDNLDEESKISYRLFEDQLKNKIDYQKYSHYDYPVKQIHGIQSSLPSFMLNKHEIETVDDAKAYVERLKAFETAFDQVIQNLKIREKEGIIAPKFVFPYALSDCKNIMGEEGKLLENIFIKDLDTKMKKAGLNENDQVGVMIAAMDAVFGKVNPAYKKLIDYLTLLETKSKTDDGVWKFPEGDAFYQYRLEKMTTTSLTGDEIFSTGKDEVARIHGEMQDIMDQVGFEGSLQGFFKFMKVDKQFYYLDSEAGKTTMLAGYQQIVDDMEARLDEVFHTKPKAKMKVKAVEGWREKSAGKAFYEEGSPDGSRKGTFFANLYKMADMPKYEMEALAFHEGIPGHHMQTTIAQELKGLPEFRKRLWYTAYGEGWGLYCEYLPKEMGFYEDPYSDFGRLAMELWRACRLAVDVGIHQNKWTREEAIAYLMENTPNSQNSCTKAIERYIVMPGQATGYKIGMIHILKMRKKAELALGDKYDIRTFHDIFLKTGCVPLYIFEERIDAWIDKEK